MSNSDFRFDLGSLSLNFVATVGARCSDQPVERLPTPEHLARWLRSSGMFREEDTLPPPDETARLAAIALREVLHRVIHDFVHGQAVKQEDLDDLNAAARAAHPPVPQLSLDDDGLAAIAPVRHITLTQIFAIIARDMIEVLSGPQRGLLRECASPTCDGIYLDHSRGFRRRWCSSKTCGNQVRVERFRTKTLAKG
jgi:predicted RNA-binding Zn ribbon-like protein